MLHIRPRLVKSIRGESHAEDSFHGTKPVATGFSASFTPLYRCEHLGWMHSLPLIASRPSYTRGSSGILAGVAISSAVCYPIKLLGYRCGGQGLVNGGVGCS